MLAILFIRIHILKIKADTTSGCKDKMIKKIVVRDKFSDSYAFDNLNLKKLKYLKTSESTNKHKRLSEIFNKRINN